MLKSGEQQVHHALFITRLSFLQAQFQTFTNAGAGTSLINSKEKPPPPPNYPSLRGHPNVEQAVTFNFRKITKVKKKKKYCNSEELLKSVQKFTIKI
jgi:hypothetical protein